MMKTFANLFRAGFMFALFMGFAAIASAQSTTVAVTNNTSCAMAVTVYGWTTIGPCNVIAEAQGIVNPGVTTNLTFLNINTRNTVAAYVTGAASDPNSVPGVAGTSWQIAQKSVPGSSCVPTITGYTPTCIGFNVNFTPTLNVTVD